MELFGTELENVEYALLCYLFAVALLFLPDLFGIKGYSWTIKIIAMIVLLPVSYFIINFVANR